jgi:hypothetical protein
MIEPRLLTLQDLFTDRIHYEIPIYQRSYVWNREDQWLPLWEDIADAATQRLLAKSKVAHFLGAIVIELTSADPGHVKVFSVIDGQQRLTTLQLLLAALRTVASARDEARDQDIRRMIRNDGRHAEGALLFKVWPSRHDQEPFSATVDPEDEVPASTEGIPGAYHFFVEQINAWLGDAETPDDASARLDALQDTVESLLQVVAITLDGSSDAQVIFETLNSRGADLTSLDLAKNALLRLVAREGVEDVGQLHAKYWEAALGDGDYWLEKVRQGRYTSERADLFLMHWLTMKMGKPARVQHLFSDFRKQILQASPTPDAATIVKELSGDAQIYRSFDNFAPFSTEGLFFQRLDAMDTTTLIPVALLLFRTTELTAKRRNRALKALESWLVRRMLLGATTQHYNRLLASLLTELHDPEALARADDVVLSALRGYENPTDQWPVDDTVRSRLEREPLYNWISQKRIRMILEACEDALASSNKSEHLPLPAKLSIEHALPQSWEGHWDLPLGVDPEEAATVRNEHRDLLGNLTLVTSALNASLSNAPWSKKRLGLKKLSQLLINQRLCEHETWDEKLIDVRGAEMSAIVLGTWPGPEADVWQANDDQVM